MNGRALGLVVRDVELMTTSRDDVRFSVTFERGHAYAECEWRDPPTRDGVPRVPNRYKLEVIGADQAFTDDELAATMRRVVDNYLARRRT